jgi:hypothetical protein
MNIRIELFKGVYEIDEYDEERIQCLINEFYDEHKTIKHIDTKLYLYGHDRVKYYDIKLTTNFIVTFVGENKPTLVTSYWSWTSSYRQDFLFGCPTIGYSPKCKLLQNESYRG